MKWNYWGGAGEKAPVKGEQYSSSKGGGAREK